MFRILYVCLFFVCCLVPFYVSAEQGDIYVGDVQISELKWGDQTVDIEIENKTDYLKFIIANTDLSFEGIYTNPQLTTTTTFILEPLEKKTISPKLFIPGNYGTATVQLNLYDVIDTLDALMPWLKCYEQPFILKFTPSDDVFPYLQEKITFPPRTEDNPYFDNEFIRLLFMFLSQGKSIEEIAKLNKCDTSFVLSQLPFYVDNNFLMKQDGKYIPTFPIISKEEAEDARKIADTLSDQLAALIAENLKSYSTVVDSLTYAKAFPRDSNDMLSGASLLYKPTPVVSALVLWFELGRQFISRAAPLLIYNATDICNAKITQYMYMVDGGPYLNGSHFYGFFDGIDSYSMMFCEDKLQIICKENFHLNTAPRSGVWKYDMKILPEFFIIDTTKARPLINVVTKGSDELLNNAYYAVRENALAHGHPKMFIGHRYWFWNLTATLTLEKLFKNGTLDRREKNFYRFDKIKGSK